MGLHSYLTSFGLVKMFTEFLFAALFVKFLDTIIQRNENSESPDKDNCISRSYPLKTNIFRCCLYWLFEVLLLASRRFINNDQSFISSWIYIKKKNRTDDGLRTFVRLSNLRSFSL